MPPVGDEYSSISQADFDLLVTSEITPQIAGQWLYNVKQFTRTIMQPVYPATDPPTAEPVTYYYTACDPLVFPAVLISDHHTNPQLRFYDQRLRASTNCTVKYGLSDVPNSTLNAAPYLINIYFVKKEKIWYVGAPSYLFTGIRADLDKLEVDFVQYEEADTTTSVITQKFYP
jgi:hypothetical protein